MTTTTNTTALRPGYRCECTTYTPAALNGAAIVAVLDATTPAQAVRWIRVAVRTLASSLEPLAAQHAWEWITDGYRDALEALDHGHPCAFTITHADTRVQWTARPVTYLPLTHHQTESPKICAEQLMRHGYEPSTSQQEPTGTTYPTE